MGKHPLKDFVQRERITAGRIVRRIFQFWVSLAPPDSQPRRETTVVRFFIVAQQRKILVIADEFFQRGAGFDLVTGVLLRQLLLERRPRGGGLLTGLAESSEHKNDTGKTKNETTHDSPIKETEYFFMLFLSDVYKITPMSFVEHE